MSDQRRIHVGWDEHLTQPETLRIVVECPDEITEMLLLDPSPELRSMFLVPEAEAAESDRYRPLIEEHRRRCASCQRWVR